MADRLDVLLKMYDEHASHAKLHEEQREKMTNFLFIVSGVIVSFITTAKFEYYTIPASLVLIALGIYGALFSLKHYERNRHHTDIMREFRRAIDREVTPDQSSNRKRSISELTRKGRAKHNDGFYLLKKFKDPKDLKPANGVNVAGDTDAESDDDHPELPADVEKRRVDPLGQFVLHSRLYRYWAALPLLTAVIGMIFLALAAGGFAKESPSKPTEVKIVEPVQVHEPVAKKALPAGR